MLVYQNRRDKFVALLICDQCITPGLECAEVKKVTLEMRYSWSDEFEGHLFLLSKLWIVIESSSK